MDPAAISCLCGPSCGIHKLDSLTKTIWSEDRPAAGQRVRNHSGKRACRRRACVSAEPKRKKKADDRRQTLRDAHSFVPPLAQGCCIDEWQQSAGGETPSETNLVERIFPHLWEFGDPVLNAPLLCPHLRRNVLQPLLFLSLKEKEKKLHAKLSPLLKNLAHSQRLYTD